MSRQFFVRHKGKESGPYTLDEIKKACRSATFRSNARVRRENEVEWLNASEVPECLEAINALNAPVVEVLNEPPAVSPASLVSNASNSELRTPSLHEYKVLTQKDKWFSGKFDPELLEMAINAYAKEGWTVRGITTATFPGLMGAGREEIIVLLERSQSHETEFDGIRFIEGPANGATVIQTIQIEIGGVFSSSQLKTLTDVKKAMVQEVLRLGGSAVINFKYGQRSAGLLSSVVQRDDVFWYGTGDVAIL